MVFISNRKLHVLAYSGHHRVLTSFLQQELYKIYITLIAIRVIYNIYKSNGKKVVKT